ncbi:alpha-1,3-mannosyl-glycoprotein 4-beta-N-acetylglucosaminyltransferase B-like, partial [Tachysurus ichikawai]
MNCCRCDVGHDKAKYSLVSVPDNTSHHLHKVYWRLLRAEQRGEELSYKMFQMLEKLKILNNTGANLTISNSTKESLGYSVSNSSSRRFMYPQPYTLLYLPHLSENDDSLQPRVYLGQGRSGVSLVLGIPTVRRQKQSYLVNTVSSLLFDLTPKEKSDIVIIVFVAEVTDARWFSVVCFMRKSEKLLKLNPIYNK